MEALKDIFIKKSSNNTKAKLLENQNKIMPL